MEVAVEARRLSCCRAAVTLETELLAAEQLELPRNVHSSLPWAWRGGAREHHSAGDIRGSSGLLPRAIRCRRSKRRRPLLSALRRMLATRTCLMSWRLSGSASRPWRWVLTACLGHGSTGWAGGPPRSTAVAVASRLVVLRPR